MFKLLTIYTPEPGGRHSSHPRSTLLEVDEPSHPPAERHSVSDASTPVEPEQLLRLVGLPRPNAESSPFKWVNFHTTTTTRRPTPLDALRAESQSSSKRPELAKTERSLPDNSLTAVSAPVVRAPPTSSPVSLPVASASAGPSRDQSSSSVNTMSGTPATNCPIPSALKAFFDTTRVPLDHLAPIFVRNGFDNDATLDLLCELPPEGHWEDMKNEILQQGRLAGWLAVQKGLLQRAKMLQSPQTS